jgi:outer membrane cobalamin receptor
MMTCAGNPHLKSERHMTIEVGHDGMFMGNHITGSVFYNDVDDLLLHTEK